MADERLRTQGKATLAARLDTVNLMKFAASVGITAICWQVCGRGATVDKPVTKPCSTHLGVVSTVAGGQAGASDRACTWYAWLPSNRGWRPAPAPTVGSARQRDLGALQVDRPTAILR